MTDSSPNILLIMADQMAPQALSVYGNRIVKSPNLQHLADEGVVFTNSYCNSPLCSPSRSSLLTGVLPSKIGVYDNSSELSASVPTIAHYLRTLDYRTCLSGKHHFIGPDQLHGFEERLTTDICTAEYMFFPVWEDSRKEAMKRGVPLTWGGNVGAVKNAGICKRNLQIDYDEEVQFHSIRKLYDLAREPEQRPFFLMVSFTQPHDPFTTTKKYWDLYDHEKIDMPQVAKLDGNNCDPYSRRLMKFIGFDKAEISDEQIRKARHAYYGMISDIDCKIGELLRALEDTGFSDNTVIIFTSDHGEMLGERGLWYKRSFFEWSARVPLVFHAPHIFNPQRIGKNVSLVDLLPTLFELAGGNQKELIKPFDGRSLFEMLNGNTTDWPDQVFAEYMGDGTPAPCMMIRDGAYKFVFCEPDPPLLFNLEDDPLELRNLGTETSYSEIVKEFERRIQDNWNLNDLSQDVITSQKQRMVVNHAHSKGRRPVWDFATDNDPLARYFRANKFWQETEELARLPRPKFIGTATRK